MGSSERLHLRWNDFEPNIKLGFSELRKEKEFFDVTLACGSKHVKAHKVILSACSPFFRSIIKSVPHEHPLLYFRGIKPSHMECLLSFMYSGEVSVSQEELNSFLSLAEEFQIKGLTQSRSSTPAVNSSAADEGPPNKKRHLHASEEILSKRETITIPDDEEEIQEELLPESEIENYEEKILLESQEYSSDGVDFNNVNNNMESELIGLPGSSSSTTQVQAPENRSQVLDVNAAFDLEIEKCYRKIGPKEFGCLKCKYRSTKRFSMKSHVECNHFITRGFPCNVCGYICKTRPCLRMHISRLHKKTPMFFPLGEEDGHHLDSQSSSQSTSSNIITSRK